MHVHTVASYMRRLGYKPWAAFQLERMHENCACVHEHGFRSTDCLFRRTGRTTRGLLGYIAANQQTGRLIVSSDYGREATRHVASRCRDLLDMFGIGHCQVVEGPGGFVDYTREGAPMFSSTMALLHADDGVLHNWNVYGRPGYEVTCLACLAIGPLPSGVV